jgi:hypothetical protein
MKMEDVVLGAVTGIHTHSSKTSKSSVLPPLAGKPTQSNMVLHCTCPIFMMGFESIHL